MCTSLQNFPIPAIQGVRKAYPCGHRYLRPRYRRRARQCGHQLRESRELISIGLAESIVQDAPADADSYLHRVGRAGRFGTKGLAISFVSSDGDSEVLQKIQERFTVAIPTLPETIDPATYMTS